jgi:hypothetical protein
MVDIKVNPSYAGPSILELAPVLADVQDPVEVRWQGTKAEYRVLENCNRHKFILHVSDLAAMERAATMLGNSFTFETALLATALSSLNSRKAYNWRAFSEGVGTAVTRSLLIRLSAGAIRKGVIPRMANIASECILDNVNPIDADVLLRLRVLRGN